MIDRIISHYRIGSRLGQGGMGEVYRAIDTRLERAVALKFLTRELTRVESAKKRFVREAKAASSLDHPNICTIHEINETDAGHLFIAMACYEGGSVAERIVNGPMETSEAVRIAGGIAQGLEAAHARGITHRDVKPGNVLLTEGGGVKLVDFGLAVLAEWTRLTQRGVAVGTTAYMSPEQLQGGAVDHRSDQWSLGVTLYEMVTATRPFRGARPEAMAYAIVNEEPLPPGHHGVEVPEPLWRVIRRCLRREPRARYEDTGELVAELRAVERLMGPDESTAAERTATERLTGRPYPGLSSFGEADAGFFYGREEEVATLWEKLVRRRMLAVIGPSGAGKTSFLQAGLVPARPEGWGVVHCAPADSPFSSLRQALVPELAGDTEAIREAMSEDAVEATLAMAVRWRRRHANVLLIVDQFEELFTLNAPQVQKSFADLLGRLSDENDVHVLVSLRDDFLVRCHRHPPLRAVFEDLTVIGPLEGADVRRALVEPARRLGYRIEDADLIDEMIEEVENERGALPLLAFAMSSLWELRDRERRVLTRASCERIGGVAGALVKHAESVMDQIGGAYHAMVRELFRNLVTAQGTRAVMERDALLSLFKDSERQAAAQALDRLIGSRLLTSYEVTEEDGTVRRRVEIAHESLLSNWPRLVRWQAQDADAVQMRDQVRHAARLWDERGRSADLLWTGTAFREYQLWRERYPGGLTGLEEEFVAEMTRHADRRRRRRRAMLSGGFSILLAVLFVVTALWMHGKKAQRKAEASLLLSLGTRSLDLDDDATEALAYATASLEQYDTEAARRFVVRQLWNAPPALEIDTESNWDRIPRFSPDGNHLVLWPHKQWIRVWSANGEMDPIVLAGHHEGGPQGANRAFWASDDLLITGHPLVMHRAHVWRIPRGERVRTIDFGKPSRFRAGTNVLFAETLADDGMSLRLRSWQLPDGDARDLGVVGVPGIKPHERRFAPDGSGWLYAKDRAVHFLPLPVGDAGEDYILGSHEATIDHLETLSLDPPQVYSRDENGGIRVWDFSATEPKPERDTARRGGVPGWYYPGPSGRWMMNDVFSDGRGQVWDLSRWREARPLVLDRRGNWYGAGSDIHPTGDWVAVGRPREGRVSLWNLSNDRAAVVDGYSNVHRPVAFSADGRWLATTWNTSEIRLWPLPGSGVKDVKRLATPTEDLWAELAFDPKGEYVFVVGIRDLACIIPVDGSPPRLLDRFSEDTMLLAAAVSPDGERVATAFGTGEGPRTLRLWDADTAELQLLELPEPAQKASFGGAVAVSEIVFTDESTLYTAGAGGVYRWNLDDGTHERVFAVEPKLRVDMSMSPDGRLALVAIRDTSLTWRAPRLFDVASGSARTLANFHAESDAALDDSGTIAATGHRDGTVQVGRLSVSEPHLLLGHEGPVDDVAISPDGRWVASTGQDNTLRLWPVPDLSRPPLHTLSLDDLIAKLHSLTNLRVVRVSDANEGWSPRLDDFPGWVEAPRWK